jgi:DNA-binding winged helix-turn-helix (wHTH) protein
LDRFGLSPRLTRGGYNARAMDVPTASDRRRICRFGVFEFDLQSRELRKSGSAVRLPDQAARILSALLAKPGSVVTREDLISVLWPDGTHVDFESGLNAAVKKLRRALDDSGDSPRYVETLPRLGYRLMVPVVVPEVQARSTPASHVPGLDPPRVRRTHRGAVVMSAASVLVNVVLLLILWRGLPVLPSSARGSGRPSTNPEANAYFRKSGMLAGVGVHDVVRARSLMEQALGLDPHFGKARVEYGFFGFIMVLAGYTNDPAAVSDAEREIQRGMNDDPTFSHGRAALAAVRLFGGKKEESRRQAEIALAMNPGDVDARHWLCGQLVDVRPEPARASPGAGQPHARASFLPGARNVGRARS